ncbi:hypothetical protein L873DRAFT_1796672, partial [Choiromyces venosus 120613-1]
MSEALSHSSHGSQGSLGPDDSISQVLPPYFWNNFQLDIDLENDDSAHSDTLSSAPSGLLTATLDSNSNASDLTGVIFPEYILMFLLHFFQSGKREKDTAGFQVTEQRFLKKESGAGGVLVSTGLYSSPTLIDSLGPRHRAPLYTDSSTKNMNQHLAISHGITKEYPEGGQEISSAA